MFKLKRELLLVMAAGSFAGVVAPIYARAKSPAVLVMPVALIFSLFTVHIDFQLGQRSLQI
jgi:hypothetical protein